MKLDLATGLQGSAANISQRDRTTRAASQMGALSTTSDAKPVAKKSVGHEFERSLDRMKNDQPIVTEPAKNRDGATSESQTHRQSDKGVEERPEAREQKASRQTAMQIFLNNMQSELGVSSEKILQAFSELDVEQLTGSPESSAQAFVAKLGLDEQKSLKALDFYNEMLAMTAMAGMSSYLVNQGQQAQVQVLDPKEARAQSLRRSLGDMSDRFFVTGKHALSKGPQTTSNVPMIHDSMAFAAKDALQTPAVAGQGSQNQISPMITQPLPQPQSSGAFELNGDEWLDADSSPIEMGRNVDAFQLEDMDAQMAGGDGSWGMDSSAFAQGAVPQNEGQGLRLSQAQNSYLAEADSAGMGADQFSPISGLQSESSERDSDFEDRGESLDGYQIDRSSQLTSSTSNMKSPSAFIVGAPQPTEAEVHNNVQELISKAQFLAQKGGGEMKVTLRPDGLGEVNLRVQMQDGSVNVEMLTESNEAKKIIEKGLDELKHNLASHKLSLDSIKIETGKETSNQMDQRGQDLERGFQQKFLGDFQQRNSNFRREMVEFQSASGIPNSQTRDRAMNSRYDSGQKRKTDSSRRLDLVA